MANPSLDAIPDRFEVKATASDHFSWLRTRLSVERTMMSWVRTATALIGFRLHDRPILRSHPGDAGSRSPYFPHAPRYLGLSLIFCGVMALVISDLGIPLGASLPLERKLCDDRGCDAGRKADAHYSRWRSCLPSSEFFAFFAVLFRLV